MINETITDFISKLDELSKDKQPSVKIAEAYMKAARMAVSDNEIKYALEQSNKAKKQVENVLINALNKKYNDIWDIEEALIDKGIESREMAYYYDILRFEAKYKLDSFCIYVEKNRPYKERFYLPRRKTLILVVDKLQKLEDDELDMLFVHMPPRVGKSQIITMYAAWHCARNTELSNLFITYKESLGGAFLAGVVEILTDPTYLFADVFPNVFIVSTDAKNNKLDLNRKKKYKSLSGKGLESGLNGEYDAHGVMIFDDILEGVQDVMNQETLRRKQMVFDNNAITRKKENCKVIFNGTIWSLHDIYSNYLEFLQNNPDSVFVRWDIIKIPALNENDESNFDYKYGVGYSTKYYRALRTKFEENGDMAGWMAQFQQEPIERDGAEFCAENMHFYNGVLPEEGLYKITAACDVALGGADFLSFAVAYMYENGDVYIHDVVFDDSNKDITQPKVIDCIKRNCIGSVFFEANQGGEGYAGEVDKELKSKGIKINIRTEYAPTNMRKVQRILDKSPTIRSWYFRDKGCRDSEYRKFMNNLYSFSSKSKSKKKHEDAADSLASLAYFIEGTWSAARVEATYNPFRNMIYGGYR